MSVRLIFVKLVGGLNVFGGTNKTKVLWQEQQQNWATFFIRHSEKSLGLYNIFVTVTIIVNVYYG